MMGSRGLDTVETRSNHTLQTCLVSLIYGFFNCSRSLKSSELSKNNWVTG